MVIIILSIHNIKNTYFAWRLTRFLWSIGGKSDRKFGCSSVALSSVLWEDGDTSSSSLSLSSCLSLIAQNQVLFRFHNSLWDLRILHAEFKIQGILKCPLDSRSCSSAGYWGGSILPTAPNPEGKEMSLGPLSVRTTISYSSFICRTKIYTLLYFQKYL